MFDRLYCSLTEKIRLDAMFLFFEKSSKNEMGQVEEVCMWGLSVNMETGRSVAGAVGILSEELLTLLIIVLCNVFFPVNYYNINNLPKLRDIVILET